MIPAIMKVGTWSSGAYFLWGKRSISDYKIGNIIKFKPQMIHGARWENGRITDFSHEMPLVERI